MTSELIQQLPVGFGAWPAIGQAATLFFSTFVLEDVAAVGAGLLLSAGNLAWPTAFWACFLGIWIGDAGLYFLARFAGRTWFEKSCLRKFSARVEESERWFSRRGNSILIFSRILPGARLPTYLAAGFLRLPLTRFLFITGAASLVWTILILFVTKVVGTKMLDWFALFQNGWWTIPFGIALAFALARCAKHFSKPDVRKRIAAVLGRWRRWEFWPAWLFYPPVAVYYLWLAIKYRGITLPTASNPGIFSGGLVGESKMATLRDLFDTSPEFTAEAELVVGSTPEQRLGTLREICERRQFSYPLILKPDVGQRGVGVKLIRNEEQASAYFEKCNAPLIVQRYAEGPFEIGVFYYRFPQETRGQIFAITEKIFPVIVGDGSSTISELVWNDPRARFMAGKYLARLEKFRDEVLPIGENLKLVEAGNHAEGCIFQDGMHLCTPKLTGCIDAISQKLAGFYIGRYDIRYTAEEDLKTGKNLQIVELNGSASEATNIYDPRNSLFVAYRILFQQWNLVFAIGAANRKRGCSPMNLFLLWRKWREFGLQAATYPAAD